MDFWKNLCGDADDTVLPYIFAIVGNALGIALFASFFAFFATQPFFPLTIICLLAVAVCLVNIFRIGFGLFKYIRKD